MPQIKTDCSKKINYSLFFILCYFFRYSLDIIFAENRKNTQSVFFPVDNDAGVPEGIRTPDLLVRSQSLYPAELQAHCSHNNIYYITFILICQALFLHL